MSHWRKATSLELLLEAVTFKWTDWTGLRQSQLVWIWLLMFVGLLEQIVSVYCVCICLLIWCLDVRLNTPLHRWILYRRSRWWQVPEGGAWCVFEIKFFHFFHFFHFFQRLPASRIHVCFAPAFKQGILQDNLDGDTTASHTLATPFGVWAIDSSSQIKRPMCIQKSITSPS